MVVSTTRPPVTMRLRKPLPRTAAYLAASFAAQGFTEGAPNHASGVAVDTATAKRRKCQACKNRGLTFRPFSNGPRYRGLCECPACGHGEEV